MSLCTQVAYGTANCAKRFGLGFAASGIISPVAGGVTYLAQKGGLITVQSAESSLREVLANPKKSFPINEEAVLNAPCKIEELANQLNNHPLPGMPHVTPLLLKVAFAIPVVLIAPIFEEIICRGLMQDLLLTRIPKYIVKKIAPGRETALDSSIAKAVRIALTSVAFSAVHLSNKGIFADSTVNMQLVSALIVGIGCGIIKESKAGLLGSIGAHMSHNFIAISPLLWTC